METRSTQERIYAHEFSTRAEHARLLDLLKGLKCMVAISGYPCAWYDQQLSGWRAIQFTAMTRSGTAVEKLWMNYPEPVKLHDYRYLGEDYRERERIKKKKTRWNNRLSSMPAAERYALLDTINELWGEMPNELALYAGGGGGLLATRWILGWKTVCYVEKAAYPVAIPRLELKTACWIKRRSGRC